MTDTEADLTFEREQIDRIDYQIHDLLNERAQHSIRVANIKITQDGKQAQFYRPEREAQIRQRICNYNRGPQSDEAVIKIFETIISESIKLQQQQLEEQIDD